MISGFYVEDFILLYVANLLNVISPGANVAVTIRNSTVFSRKIGLMTSAGIVSSSFIHKMLTLCGFGLVVSQIPWLFNLIRYAGCIYLFYLGLKCIWNALEQKIRRRILGFLTIHTHINQKNRSEKFESLVNLSSISKFQAFRAGFLTDLLNPQAPLFFITLVAATVRPETPFSIQIVYGLILIATSVVWYFSIALFFSHPLLTEKFCKAKPWTERVAGVSLLFFSYKLLNLGAIV